MDITEFLGIAVVGSLLSLIIEFIKKKWGTATIGSRLFTVIFAVVVGSVYWFLSSTQYWVSIVGVLTISSTFYAFFLKK